MLRGQKSNGKIPLTSSNGNGAEAKKSHLILNDSTELLCLDLLQKSGEDPAREGLQRTPFRFARAMKELTQGYRQNITDVVGKGIFEEENSDLVMVRDIEFYSLCEHHLLPFFGKAHVAYVPDGKIIGLSKIPRLVHMFARRFQVQERLTNQIADALEEILAPRGVACVVEGNHMCMMMRGVQSQSSSMFTIAVRGIFAEEENRRKEFLDVVRPK